MFVSILQRMGFFFGMPVNSRANERSQSPLPEASDKGRGFKASDRAEGSVPPSASEVEVPVNSARRQEMKTQPEKASVAANVTSAAAGVKFKEKSASKGAPVAKSTAQPEGAAKKPAKTAIAAKETKPTSQDEAKTTVVKAVKPTAKVQAKDPVKTTAKADKPEVATSKTKVAPAVTPVNVTVAESVSQVTPTVPARAGRPSSRLAQLTVPSMAQSVASTAAKASFTQSMSAPLIVPPAASALKKDPKLANNWKTTPVDQMTDAELIAMPDDEYMNETQMAYFRRKLSILKTEILSNAGETTEHLREETAVVPDPADRATIEEEHALELRTRDRERKLLKKIEQSIGRIDSGDYGYCDETGEAIGVGRLLARPTANLSLEAQQRRELKQKMFGD